MKWYDRLFRREKRTGAGESSYTDTDTLVSLILQQATGTSLVSAQATSGLEAAAGAVSRAFASAQVQPMELSETLTPCLLSQIGRALIKHGEWVGAIKVMEGSLTILPAQTWTITGSPGVWEYELTLAGPSGTLTEKYPQNGVIHIQYATDPAEPW